MNKRIWEFAIFAWNNTLEAERPEVAISRVGDELRRYKPTPASWKRVTRLFRDYNNTSTVCPSHVAVKIIRAHYLMQK